MEDLEFLIVQYLDRELCEKEQGKLFKELSINPDAKKLFDEYLFLKEEISSCIRNELNTVQIAEKTSKRFNYKKAFYFSTAVAVFFITLTFADFTIDFIKVKDHQKSVLVNDSEKQKGDDLLQELNKIRTVRITNKDIIGKKL